MRNILPEKEIGTGLVYVNVPGTLNETTTQEALQRGTGPKPAKISGLRDPFLYLYLAISLSLSLSLTLNLTQRERESERESAREREESNFIMSVSV